MNPIAILADSTCDLSPELVLRHRIEILPLHVSFPNDSHDYRDGIDLQSEDVYRKAEESKSTPKTGALNVYELIEFFRVHIDRGEDVLFTGIGSGLSSTYQNALLAAQSFPEGRIEVVDSQNLSTGTGLLVLKMAALRDEGKDVHAIAKEVRGLVPYVSAKFCIDRLDYLYRGGRCSGLTMNLAHILHIHPVAKVIDNKLQVVRKVRGRYRRAVDAQLEEFEEDLPAIDPFALFVTDSGHMEGEDEYMLSKARERFDPERIYHTRAGCVVSSHCGPKTIGILYLLDPKKVRR